MKFMLPLLLVLLGVVCRVTPHPWNFVPVGAIALFAGATFANRRAAILLPLVMLFAGDTALEWFTGQGYHSLMPVVYATYALIAMLGWLLRERRDSPLAIAGGATAGAILFFVTTNFAVWAMGDLYPHTFAGLVTCFVAAVPFFERTLMSDLLFSAIFFGVYAIAARRVGVASKQWRG
jgi:hypothetical protein